MAFDAELLELAVARTDALAALSEGPHHRRELQERLGVSKTTAHRILRSFEEHDLTRRTEDGRELTLFGEIVADWTARFAAGVEQAARLRRLFDLFEATASSFEYDVFRDPEIDWEIAESESYSIDRGIERVRGVDVLRVLDWTPVPDLYHEAILDILAEEAARVESIYPKSEVNARLERFPDRHDELIESGARPRYWVYEDVPPWGMSIYDDELVELRAYDQQSGAYLLDATSDHPDAVDWALAVFEEYRDRASPVTAFDDLPDWGDYSW